MSRLQLTREINVERVEAFLDTLTHDPNQDIEAHDMISSAFFGGEVALMQLFFTWAKNNPSGKLWLKKSSEDGEFDRFIEKLSLRAFGFVAMLMAGDVRSSDDQSCRPTAYKWCESWVDRMTTSTNELTSNQEERADENLEIALDRSVRGHRTFLPCVDRSTKAKIVPFYHANGRFKERSEFQRFAELLIERRAEQFVKANTDVIRGLGAILYELMHNTHDWARTEVDGTELRKSIRGILFTRQYLPEASIGKAAGGATAIENYMKAVAGNRPGQPIHLAELSVFDSGPGLAKRWLSQSEESEEPTVEQEHNACVACLGVHRTTSSEAYRGVGLFDVMNTLERMSAFVRVRTGRVAMLRDFIDCPISKAESETGLLLPLSPEHENRPAGLADVVGTVFTILFPLK